MVKSIKNNKKNLQEQIAKLNNEVEELRLEREESKKNVLHFMQEADTARQELSKTKELMKELQNSGYTTPPLSSSSDEEEDEENDTISLLLLHPSDPPFFDSMNHQEEDRKISTQTIEKKEEEEDDKKLEEMQTAIKRYQLENAELEDELDQTRHEYQATRQALRIENERAETIENRWKESENNLEQAELTIHQLNTDLEKYRQLDWSMKLANKEKEDAMKRDEIESWKTQYHDALSHAERTKEMLMEKEDEVREWKERFEKLYHERSQLEDQKTEMDQAKIKENHLKTINRSLRDELRKMTKAQENSINIAYLRNVIINFLEKKKQRTQLIPILSTLLQCEKEDKARLFKLAKTKVLIKERT